MASLQVRNLPEDLHQRLRQQAQRQRRTISDITLEAIEREVARYDWRDKLSLRPATHLGVSAASSLLEEERRKREKELA